jgi:hypothetical protein
MGRMNSERLFGGREVTESQFRKRRFDGHEEFFSGVRLYNNGMGPSRQGRSELLLKKFLQRATLGSRRNVRDFRRNAEGRRLRRQCRRTLRFCRLRLDVLFCKRNEASELKL